MPTWTALTTLADKSAAETLGDAMERLDPTPTGVGVMEMEDGSGLYEVGGYFVDPPDEAGLAVLAAAFDARPFAVSEVPDVNWVAHVQRELAPISAGRFYVYGNHDADTVPADKHPLLIEAAMAFGTGHHGTTLGCLQLLDRLASDGHAPDRIADIGCGTAVLAMAAARVWPAHIVASDIDPVAVEVAEANLAANGLSGRVRCVTAAGFDHPELTSGGPYELILANILKGPLLALAPTVLDNLALNGWVILSGILNEQADEVLEVYARSGINLCDRISIGDWTSLTLRKLG